MKRKVPGVKSGSQKIANQEPRHATGRAKRGAHDARVGIVHLRVVGHSLGVSSNLALFAGSQSTYQGLGVTQGNLKIERKALLDKLTLVAPALSTISMIPILTHFWFTGTHLMAFNDNIAISTPLKTDFVGATPGNVLWKSLKLCMARDIELSAADGNLLMRAGNTRFKLELLPPETFAFDMPQVQSRAALPLDSEEFLDCVAHCLHSVNMDTSRPEQMGVTLLVGEDGRLNLFGTDRVTISHGWVQLWDDVPFTRIILPAEFCRQLLMMADPAALLHIQINSDYVLFVGNNNVTMYGRLVEQEQLGKERLDFNKLLNGHYPPGTASQLVKIPSQLEHILERACFITDSKVERPITVITVQNKIQQSGETVRVMHFVSKSDLGEITDAVLMPKHPEARFKVDPNLLKVAYGRFTHMAVTESALIMAERNKLYLVSAG